MGEACPAMRWGVLERAAVQQVGRDAGGPERLWQLVSAGTPAARARRLIICRAFRRVSGRPVRRSLLALMLWKSGALGFETSPAAM